ncbi:hypothetical protein H0H92_004256 [Tricholoma furcatifolium]|nr:hypothetical protein H0H92_004256 [Tricholoma furcatifolium]
MDPMALELKNTLKVWREEVATSKFGKLPVRRFGAKLLMADKTVERLVACAQAQKLQSINDIIKETSWRHDWAEKHGEKILETIEAHIPQTPPQDLKTGKRKASKCTECGNEGHISKIKLQLSQARG